MSFSKIKLKYDIVQVNPLPSEHELAEYYQNLYYQTSDGLKTSYDAIYTNEEIDHKVLDSKIALTSLKENLKNHSDLSLLELGCGEGFFLNEAHLEKFNVTGVDFSQFGISKWHPNLTKYCYFGNIYDILFSFISESKKYDILVLKNVLEHVINPGALLESIKNLLSKESLVLISVPNDYTELQKKALELNHIPNEFWFSPPDHLHYFNTKNIVKFVENLEFKVVDLYTSFPIDFFLFHPGSNYILNKENGKAAHHARINLDLLMAKEGLFNLLNLYRAMARCCIGRNLTVLIKLGHQ